VAQPGFIFREEVTRKSTRRGGFGANIA